MATDIKVSELNEIIVNRDLNEIIVNRENTTNKIKICNFLSDCLIKTVNIGDSEVSREKIALNTITGTQIGSCEITSNSLATNSVNNRIICNTDNFIFNAVEVGTDTIIKGNISLSGNIIMQENYTVDGRDISADGIKLDQLCSAVSTLSANIDSVEDNINNGVLTLLATGIATGMETFSANQFINSNFTINVPGTNLSILNTTLSSSTGNHVILPNASTVQAGLMSSTDFNKLTGIEIGAQKNVNTNLSIINSPTNNVCLSSSTGNFAIIPVATNNYAGLMSSTDFNKLTGIESGAQKNVITCVAGRVGDVILTSNDVGLGNVTNDMQICRSSSIVYTPGNIPTWGNNTGDLLSSGYGIDTSTLSNSNNVATAGAIRSYVNSRTGNPGGTNSVYTCLISLCGPYNAQFCSSLRSGQEPVDQCTRCSIPRPGIPINVDLPWPARFVILYPVAGRIKTCIFEGRFDNGVIDPDFSQDYSTIEYFFESRNVSGQQAYVEFRCQTDVDANLSPTQQIKWFIETTNFACLSTQRNWFYQGETGYQSGNNTEFPGISLPSGTCNYSIAVNYFCHSNPASYNVGFTGLVCANGPAMVGGSCKCGCIPIIDLFVTAFR
jgi:outer membrane murein-binding lipoprotein Lpp